MIITLKQNRIKLGNVQTIRIQELVLFGSTILRQVTFPVQ